MARIYCSIFMICLTCVCLIDRHHHSKALVFSVNPRCGIPLWPIAWPGLFFAFFNRLSVVFIINTVSCRLIGIFSHGNPDEFCSLVNISLGVFQRVHQNFFFTFQIWKLYKAYIIFYRDSVDDFDVIRLVLMRSFEFWSKKNRYHQIIWFNLAMNIPSFVLWENTYGLR